MPPAGVLSQLVHCLAHSFLASGFVKEGISLRHVLLTISMVSRMSVWAQLRSIRGMTNVVFVVSISDRVGATDTC